MGISSTPLAVEAYRRLLIVRRVADGIVSNHHCHKQLVPTSDCSFWNKSLDRKGGAAWEASQT